MKVLVLGSGLMGPAVAYNALTDPEVTHVTICDLCQSSLDTAFEKLKKLKYGERLTVRNLDLTNQEEAKCLLSEFDVIVSALSQISTHLGIQAALAAKKPLVDLHWPTDMSMEEIDLQARKVNIPIVLGCGVEPGLTEIMTRFLAEKLDQVDEVHIKCGGIPEKPTPPLGYKIVFGGTRLPLSERDARIVKNGKLYSIPKYSEAESVFFHGVGECEAWHEGFMPWLMDLPALKNLKLGTQKTCRWPGYAEKVTILREMGFLSNTPITIGDSSIAPKAFADNLLYPRVRMDENERDITLFRVEVMGKKNGFQHKYCLELIDRYDEVLGFTSMARTTGFTGAIVARLIAKENLNGAVYTPEQVITGPLLHKLLAELSTVHIRFTLTTESEEYLN